MAPGRVTLAGGHTYKNNMPRRARLAIPDVPLHVTQRGNNRCACFMGASDRLVYMDLLVEHLGGHGIALHAYVLMTNHVHLLLTPPAADALGNAMRHVNQRYAQYFNRRYQRTGTLWEGRPHSCLVDAGPYLFTCYRYVENNPVRAGMVRGPEAYPWSSHRANALGARDPLVTPHPLVVALGRSDDERRQEYRRLFSEDDKPEVIENLRRMTASGLALGRESFTTAAASALGLPTARGKPGRPPRRRCG